MYEELKCIKVQQVCKGHPITNPLPTEMVTLDTLYKDGWWITEIFGSTAVLVHPARPNPKSKRPKFRLLCKHITVDTMTKAAERTIKRIQKEQWNIYKDNMLLTGRKKRYRIKTDGKE